MRNIKLSVVSILLIVITAAALFACTKPIISSTITFVANGGSDVASIQKTAGEAVSAPLTPTKTGYTFEGWYNSEQLATRYIFDKMPDKDITLYAKWEAVEVTVTFEKGGGEGGDNTVEIAYEQPMSEADAPTRTGFIFDGYYTNTAGGGIKYYNADMTSARASDLLTDTMLYANWINTYQIIFNSNGGSDVSALTVIKDVPFAFSGIPELNGFYFGGWFLDNNTFQVPVDTNGIHENIVAYAQWIPYFGTPFFNGTELEETGINRFNFSFPATDDYDHTLLTFAIANPDYTYIISEDPVFVEGEAMVMVFIYNADEEKIGEVEINIMAISEE